MSDKDYIPDISEFHEGFEYEYFEPVNKKGWVQDSFFLFQSEDIYEGLKEKAYRPIRVKYLDKEDIESLGWKHIGGKLMLGVQDDFELPYNDPRKNHDKVQLIFNYRNNWCLICIGDYEDWDTRFAGYIKNKSELQRLMKQLGI